MGYETKDSGERKSFPGGGVRDSAEGKPRPDLLFPKTVPYAEQMLTRMAALMARGAEKYASRNWEKFCTPEALEHAEGSFGRHADQWRSGETDEDHAAAVMINVMFVEYIKGVLDGKWPALGQEEEQEESDDENLRTWEHNTVAYRVEPQVTFGLDFVHQQILDLIYPGYPVPKDST